MSQKGQQIIKIIDQVFDYERLTFTWEEICNTLS